MDRDSGLDELIRILEEYRKEYSFSTITVQIRNYEYAHIKRTVTESTPIKGKGSKNVPSREHSETET